MSHAAAPVTAAVRVLRAAGVAYTEHRYRYEEHGGTRVSARELGVDEHAVVKTLVMEDDARAPLIVARVRLATAKKSGTNARRSSAPSANKS